MGFDGVVVWHLDRLESFVVDLFVGFGLLAFICGFGD